MAKVKNLVIGKSGFGSRSGDGLVEALGYWCRGLRRKKANGQRCESEDTRKNWKGRRRTVRGVDEIERAQTNKKT